MELTAQNVEKIAIKCLYTEEEIEALGGRENIKEKLVRGIGAAVAWNPIRLKEEEQNIIDMLHQLPSGFQKDSPEGGLSFLCAFETNKGVHWGEHPKMDILFMLGTAVDAVECMLPREAWGLCPGGVPYYRLTK